MYRSLFFLFTFFIASISAAAQEPPSHKDGNVYKSNEKWHRLKIKLNMPNPPPKELKDLSARARDGFYLVPAGSKE